MYNISRMRLCDYLPILEIPIWKTIAQLQSLQYQYLFQEK